MTNAAHEEQLPSWTLGDRLRKARLHASLGTTAEMARRLHCHRNSVIGYESDRVRPPLDVVVRYSRLAHIPLDWFVGDYDPDIEEVDAVTIRYPMLLAVAA
jgi:transcriptional regulator with XRE-family HTH domain